MFLNGRLEIFIAVIKSVIAINIEQTWFHLINLEAVRSSQGPTVLFRTCCTDFSQGNQFSCNRNFNTTTTDNDNDNDNMSTD